MAMAFGRGRDGRQADEQARRSINYVGWNGGPNEYVIVELPIHPEG